MMISAAASESVRDRPSRVSSSTTKYAHLQESEDEGASLLANSSSSCCRGYGETQEAVRLLMDDPESSGAAMAIHYFVVVLISLSTLHAVVQTVDEVSKEYETQFYFMETAFTICFTVEILTRIWISPSCAAYCCQMSNAVDILATLPWYIELIMDFYTGCDELDKFAGSMRTLRMVRLVRMVRLLRILRLAKAARQSVTIGTVLESIGDSLEGMFVMVFLVGTCAVMSATIVYAIESENEEGNFSSIPSAMWWSLATITTVGYGDVVPATVPGKAVACLTMVIGTIVVSVSVAAITTSFTDSYHKRMNFAKIAKTIKKAKLPQSVGSSGRSSGRARVVAEETETDRRCSERSTERSQSDLISTFAALEDDMKEALERLECLIEMVHSPEGDAASSAAANTASVAQTKDYAELALQVLQEQSHTLFKSVMSFVEHLAHARADPAGQH